MTRMTVNGEAIHYRLDPETPLLSALRDASNLTGTKYGCDDGSCGACTVIVDGRAVTSCTVPIASLEGAQVTTIEGLSSGRSHPVQRAWAAEQVSMCGYCEPGFIMAIAALIFVSYLVLLVPEFRRIYDDFGVQLPWITMQMIRLSDLLGGRGSGFCWRR